jgi:hypothetical protein
MSMYMQRQATLTADAWRRSKKGYDYLQLEDCTITVFKSEGGFKVSLAFPSTEQHYGTAFKSVDEAEKESNAVLSLRDRSSKDA